MSTDALDKAIAASTARKGPRPIVLSETTIRITQEAIAVKASGDLSFSRAEDSDPAIATLLLWDPKINAFRPVLTPPGTSWELVEKRQGMGLWHPGMRT